ncbi:hypothetical protein ABK040_010088 [Willaertia magna]
MNLIYALAIILVALCTGLLTTFVEWVFIYRKAEYQDLQQDIEDLQKKIDKSKKDAGLVHKGGSISAEEQKNKKRKKEKLKRDRELLKAKTQELSMFKMRSTIIVGVIMVSVFGLMNSIFDGRVVAKLPFEPFSIFHMFTHRNLPGNNFTDCGMLFIYILASNSIKSSIQRYFGFAQDSGQPSMFALPEEDEE